MTTNADRLARLVETMIDNEPDDIIADGGHIMLDLWRHDARKALADYRSAKSGEVDDPKGFEEWWSSSKNVTTDMEKSSYDWALQAWTAAQNTPPQSVGHHELVEVVGDLSRLKSMLGEFSAPSFVDFFPALDDAITALSSKPIQIAGNPCQLIWEEQSSSNNWCHVAKTPFGDYYVHVDGGTHQAWAEWLAGTEQFIGEPSGSLYTEQMKCEEHFNKLVAETFRPNALSSKPAQDWVKIEDDELAERSRLVEDAISRLQSQFANPCVKIEGFKHDASVTAKFTIQEQSDYWLQKCMQEVKFPNVCNLAISALRMVDRELSVMNYLPVGHARRHFEDIASPASARQCFEAMIALDSDAPNRIIPISPPKMKGA